MPVDLNSLAALMPFARHLGLVTVQASLYDFEERLVAQTTRIRAVG